MKLTFDKSYEFEGTTYKELDIPLENINGKELLKYHKSYVNSKAKPQERVQASNLLLTVSGDPDFAIFIAASASQQPIEFFENLPAKEVVSVIAQISSFLLA